MKLKMRHFISSLIIIVSVLSSCSRTEPVLKIGLVADPQYADKPAAGNRYYRASLWKLEEAIDTFNSHRVDFVQNLGDIIDGGWGNYDSILPVYLNLNPGIENYHLLGNHDFAIDSSHLEGLLEILSMPGYYYSYVKKSWKFIVLDATDCSYYANCLHKRDTALINAYYNDTEGRPNHKPWNGAIGKEQQEWLKKELESAESSGQKVIVFSHMPLRPLNTPENLWNNHEITDILENSSCVKAFINGHRHSGNYDFNSGIHYFTVFGMVETMVNSYGMLEIYRDSLVLTGYGNQKSCTVPLCDSRE
jgi:manganese-dependent ADP-ribose/CDP-alcohol diphosphatase